jgi:hypothetical protein
MINLSIGMSLLRTGKRRISLDFRRRDLNHPNTRIQKEVLSPVIPLEVCTNKNFPLKVGNTYRETKEKMEEQKKGPLQCWGCGEAHMLRDFPHRQHDNKRVYNVQEATTVQ